MEYGNVRQDMRHNPERDSPDGTSGNTMAMGTTTGTNAQLSQLDWHSESGQPQSSSSGCSSAERPAPDGFESTSSEHNREGPCIQPKAKMIRRYLTNQCFKMCPKIGFQDNRADFLKQRSIAYYRHYGAKVYAATYGRHSKPLVIDFIRFFDKIAPLRRDLSQTQTFRRIRAETG